jgi:hypothetical protein
MAFEDDLRSFLENRLQEFDPSIDLSTNSPAQVQIIDPTIARFGEDPFSTDIRSFVIARISQEFPELAATQGAELEDMLVSPMQLLLEPLKRAVETTRINQSVENADLMSDDEADALGANFFQEREEGDRASGPVRLYFNAPTTVRVTSDRQLTSRSGVAFFPTENTFITSAQMVFNRDGSQYFLDITVQAEEAGSEGNVSAGEIISIDDVEGVVRVSNLSDFTNGNPRQDNEDYLGGIPQALTERSLVTTRGISTRVPDTFGAQVRALQVVGAGEDGMDRDILTGTSEGFLHLVGDCSFYQSWIFVSTVRYKDDGVDNDVTIQAGDTARLILSLGDDPDRTANEAVIIDIISTGVGTASEKHILILDRTLDTLIGATGSGATVAIFKEGFLTISGLPGGISTGITVPDNEVHLGGHMDILVRPSSDALREEVLPNLTDSEPIMALLDITTSLNNNLVSSSSSFVAAGVQEGDLLVIEDGNAAGSYRVLSVGSPDLDTQLRVDSLFTSVESGLRARIVRSITVDLVEPKVPKVPFVPGPVADLQTTVGTTLFRLGTNIQSFGAAVGDTIRVLDGLNAGDYVIQSFDAVLGGTGPVVDRAAAATGFGQRYEVFTISDGLEFPLVRIRELEVLDSTNQGTGITVPYGDAVDIRPQCDFEGAGKSIRVLDKQLIIVPDGSSLIPAADTIVTPGATTDARYSTEVAVADGVIRIGTSGISAITEAEINIPPFAYNGRLDTILALTTREDPEFSGVTGDQHRTSDIAEASVGDSLVILDGPNAGNYVIRDLRILDMWAKTAPSGHRKIAVVQVDEQLKVDPLGTIIDYIADVGATAAVTSEEWADFFEEATQFFSVSGFLEAVIIPKLETTLTSEGFTITTAEVRDLVLQLATSGYDVGSSAEGTLRLFFKEPVSAEFFFSDDDPTLFQAVSNTALRYRLSPDLPPSQIFPEAEEATSPTEWNRNMVLHDGSLTDAYLDSGSSFALRGIRSGDLIEYHSAINDFYSRRDMESSWLAVTQAGSNLVRLVVPPAAEGLDNATLPEPGHLFFVDSGPDTGAYVITEVDSGNSLVSDPPQLIFRIDKSLTHTTETFPAAADRDFGEYAKSVLSTSGNVFPMTLPATAKLKIDLEGDGPWEHQFLSTSYANIGLIVSELTDTGTGTAWGSQVSTVVGLLDIFADGDELVIRTKAGELKNLTIETATAPSAVGTGNLEFVELTGDGGRVGYHAGGVAVAGTKRIVSTAFASGWSINDWISVYGVESPTPEGYNDVTSGDDVISAGEDTAYLGTFQVVSLDTISGGPRDGEAYAEINRSANFDNGLNLRFVRHSAPETSPADTTGGGKELSSSYVRGRMYREVSEQATISIPWAASPASPIEGVDDVNPGTDPSQIQLSQDPTEGTGFSHKMPYRIIRDGVKKISSTAMSENRAGALYYVDLPVLGLGVISDLNITEDEGLTLEGRHRIDGYTLRVENEVFTFSTEEEVSIILPGSVLPVGSTPDLDNEISLAGQNLQVNYDSAPVISDIQAFFDSKLDRVVVASALVRHFLPSYVFLDVIYVGGDDESEVASDLITLINNIDPDLNELSSDAITGTITKRGAIQVRQPITLIALTHGTDRRIRGTQSTNSIGGNNLPTFRGNFKQTYFIAGPNTSDEETRPDGEQVYLTRL